jgi:hypothetical protein
MPRKECIFGVLLLCVQTAAQGVPVLENPAAGANQNIVQLPDTTTQRNPGSFSVNNEAGIRYSVGCTWSSIWVSCPAGDSISNNFKPIGALLLQSGTEVSDGTQGGLKGRLNLMSPSGTLPATHLITLGDSNPAKTLATPGHRPTNDVNDTWIGLDNANAVPSGFQLAFGAPLSISNYIGAVGNPQTDTPLERLQLHLKTFTVPITTSSLIISTLTSGPPFSVLSTAPVTNLTSQFAQGLIFTGTTGSIGGSPLNAGQCTSGTATVPGALTSMTAVASPSSNPLADANHGLAIWAYVSATNTVTVEVCAIIAQTTPTQTTYNVRVSL